MLVKVTFVVNFTNNLQATFCYYSIDEKIRTHTVAKEKLLKTLSYENVGEIDTMEVEAESTSPI